MKKNFQYYLSIDIEAEGFKLGAKDALTTAENIMLIYTERTGWFSKPQPIHISELCILYKELCPDMEIYVPGVVDKIFHPEIITKLGFPVDSNGMVHFD
jgi:hypothetical protein